MNAVITADNLQISQAQGKALTEFDSWYAQARRVYVGQRYHDDDEAPACEPLIPQVFKIFGFAGSGKTTLAAFKARSIGSGVLAATFTGKAALVMRRKGFNCSTIHSLIYKPEVIPVLDKDGKPTGEETLGFVLNDESNLWGAKLLIIDEVSMVNQELAQDLLRFNVPILVLGDPGQLPPVTGTGYFTKGKPDVMLTEIHRQALENPIIKMSMDIRLGRGVQPGAYGNSKVIRKIQFNSIRSHELVTHDQVICGINRTRRTLNADIRKYRGFELLAQPMVGDRLICLRNDRKRGLFNGGMWFVKSPPQFDGEVFEMELDSLDIKGAQAKVKVPLEFFIGEEEKLPGPKRRKHDEFDFGYAITAHKSQGSQWDKVLVVNENQCFRENAIQWLYTAVTRAAEELTLVV
jgi:exodeoxyribonuclease-5